MNKNKKIVFKFKCISLAFVSGLMFSVILPSTQYRVSLAQGTETFTLDDAKLLQQGKLLGPNLELDGLSYRSLLLNPDEDPDDDGLLTKEELDIRIINGRRAVIIKSHPMLKDTDGDGLTDKAEIDGGTNPLVWDVSARDMAMFMRLAYHDDDYIHKVLDHKNELTDLFEGHKFPTGGPKYKMMHQELSPYWKVKKTYHVDWNGFDAVLFETKSDHYFLPDGEVYVIAMRGTTPGNAKDLSEDVFIGFAGRPNQAFETVKVLNDVATMNPKRVYSTGHSLGGWLAQYVASYAAVEDRYPWFRNAYTFNAPNIRASAVQKRDFKRIRDKSYELSNQGISKHYAVSNDPVTRATGRMPNFIDIGTTNGGHDSNSYYEDTVSNRNDFQQGERNTMNGVGRRSPLLNPAFKLKPTPTKNERPKLNILFPAEKKKEGHVDIYNPTSVNQVKELLLDSLKPVPSRPHTRISWEPEPRLEENYGSVVQTTVTFFYPDNTSSQVEITYRYLVDKAPIENLWNDIQTRLQRSQTSEKFKNLFRPSSLQAFNEWKTNDRLKTLKSLSDAIKNDALTPTEAEHLLVSGRASYERLINALNMRERVIDKSSLVQKQEVITQMLNVDRTNKTLKSLELFTQKLDELGKDALLNELQEMTSNSQIANDATQVQVDELNRRATEFIEKVNEALDLLKEKGDTTVLENELIKLREHLANNYDSNLYINDEARNDYERERLVSSDIVKNVEKLLQDRDNLTREDIDTPLQTVRTHIQSLIEKSQRLHVKPSKEALQGLYQRITVLKNSIQEERYTPNSYKTYLAKLTEGQIEDKINSAKTVLDSENVQESQVNETLNELQEAYNKLEEAINLLQLKANKDKLNELLLKFRELEQETENYRSTHTPRSVDIYKQFIQNEKMNEQEGKRLIADDNATQEDVSATQVKLQNSIDKIEKEKSHLQLKADKQALIQAIQEIRSLISEEAIQALHLDRMTPISKDNYTNEMAKLNVNNVIEVATTFSTNDNATTEEVNEQITLLNQLSGRIQSLRNTLIPQANFEQLSTLVDRLDRIISQEYQQERYTKNSFDMYIKDKEQANEKLQLAKEQIQDLNSTQESVVEMEQEISSKITSLSEKIRLLEERADLTDIIAYKDILESFKNLDLTKKTLNSKESYLNSLNEIDVNSLLDAIVKAESNENFTKKYKNDLLQLLQEKHTLLLAAQAKLQDRADITNLKENLSELKNLLDEEYSSDIYTKKSLSDYNKVKERLQDNVLEYQALLQDENLVQEKADEKEKELIEDIKTLREAKKQLLLKPNKKALEVLLSDLLEIQRLDIEPYTILSRDNWNAKVSEVNLSQKISELRSIIENNEDDELNVENTVTKFEALKHFLLLEKEKLVLHIVDISSYADLVKEARELKKTKEYFGTSESLKLIFEEKLSLLEAIIETPESKNAYSVSEAEEIKNNLLLAISDIQLEKVSILSVDLADNRKIQIIDPASGLKGYKLKATVRKFDDGDLASKKYEAFDIYLESLVADENGNYPRLNITPNFRLTLPRILGEEVEGVYYVNEEKPYKLEKVEENDIVVSEKDITFTIQHLSTYAVVYRNEETNNTDSATNESNNNDNNNSNKENREDKNTDKDNLSIDKINQDDNQVNEKLNNSTRDLNNKNSVVNKNKSSAKFENYLETFKNRKNKKEETHLAKTGIQQHSYIFIVFVIYLIIVVIFFAKRFKNEN